MAAPNPNQPLDPAFDVTIDGDSFGDRLTGSLRQITVEDDIRLPSMFELEIEGADPMGSPIPALVDDNRLTPGKPVEIRLGYAKSLTRIFTGEIAAIEPEFSANRTPVLRVRGYDARQRLQRGARTRTFASATDSDVARQIGREAGVTVDATESRIVHDYLVQANQSDLAFLIDRADRIGFEVACRDSKLVFRPAAFGGGEAATLSVADDFLEFSASWSLAQQIAQTEVRAWSVKDKRALVGAAKGGDERAVMAGDASAKWVDRVFDGPSGDRVGFLSAADQAEADALANARFDAAGLALVCAEGKMQGRADLTAGSVIKITDAGKRFSGPYYLTSVTHRYGGHDGFLTSFRARRNAV